MGQQLLAYYTKAGQMGGMKAQMRLAMITTISSAKAGTEADSPDAVAKFENAMKELAKEFAK